MLPMEGTIETSVRRAESLSRTTSRESTVVLAAE
jgi:hypothetical protein